MDMGLVDEFKINIFIAEFNDISKLKITNYKINNFGTVNYFFDNGVAIGWNHRLFPGADYSIEEMKIELMMKLNIMVEETNDYLHKEILYYWKYKPHNTSLTSYQTKNSLELTF